MTAAWRLNSSSGQRSTNKYDKIEQVLKQCGEHPGFVRIFSVIEPYPTYQPCHDKTAASACFSIFISSMRNRDFSTSAFPRGVPSDCRLNSTGIGAWTVV